MKRLTSYRSGKPPRACVDPGDQWTDEADNWTYTPGRSGNIEVHDALEEEHWEETGLLDDKGEPIFRITRYVPNPIGFIWPTE